MNRRTPADVWSGFGHYDQIQQTMLAFGKALWQRVPEVLITISAVGLAYRLWSDWMR